MTTDYDLIAAEYKRAKQQSWRMHLEYHTLFGLLGDLEQLGFGIVGIKGGYAG